MTDWMDYEWAAIRVVPRVHTEEFVNVGVVLHARQAGFLEARLAGDWKKRVETFAPSIDIERVMRHLATFVEICAGAEDAGPVAQLPPSERFHWLTHPRSGVVQTSARHPGRTQDPSNTLDELTEDQFPPAPTPR